MDTKSKAIQVNTFVNEFFQCHPDITEIKAKDLMSELMKAGIFTNNHRDGLPLRNLLRALDDSNQLHLLPLLRVERKAQNRFWYFCKEQKPAILKQDALFKLTAANIGISSKRWKYARHNWSREKAINYMIQHHYDLLPIKEKDGNFKQFYISNKWGKIDDQHVVLKSVSDLPAIDAKMEFLDLLEYFDKAEHKFALLKSEEMVVGLISSVNFTFSEIYFRLYIVIAKFEMRLSDWIFDNMKEEDVLKLMIENKESDKSDNTIGSFLIDRERNEEGKLKEYFYLSNLLKVIRNSELYMKLGFNSKRQFKDATKNLPEIRNNIAHPVRRMIKTADDFKRLKEALQTINKIQVILN